MTRFVVVGDLMLDITAITTTPLAHASDTPANISMQPGGSAANTAAWLAHSGAEVMLVGSIGDDAAGRTLSASLTSLGVQLALTVRTDAPTGVCIVLVGPDGERTMVPDRGANAFLSEDIAPELLQGTHLHVSGYALLGSDTAEAAARLLTVAREQGATTSVDCASAAPLLEALESFTTAVTGCDLLLANEDEARVLAGLDGMQLLATTVVAKLGADGAELSGPAGYAKAPALLVNVRDSTGAGDAFAAGFLPAWAAGADPQTALAAGNALAAQAVSRVGAGPSAP